MVTYPKKGFQFNLQPAKAWTAILGLTLFSTLCVLAGVGGVLRYIFPLGSFAVALFLYQKYPILYLGFTWWIWFLTPFVRRLIDYQGGWVEPSVVLLAPFLVTLISFITFFRHLPKSYSQGGLPFLLCFGSVFYAYAIGLINNPRTGATISLLGWLTPILLAYHLFVNWRDYPQIKQNMERNFLWCALLTGGYGVVQYMLAPEWDCFWLRKVGAVAFGSPEPMGMRVFSTMNSPQPFAVVMMAALLLLFNSQQTLRFPAAAGGYLSFLLSLARSAWLGWVVGLLAYMSTLKPRFQMRLVITIMMMSIFVIPLTNIEPFSEVINSRIQSFTDTKNDASYNARQEGYNEILGLALNETLGKGMGFVLSSDSLGSNDSGLLTMLFCLGWFGTIPYLGGLFLLLFSLFQGSEARFDPFVSAARAIAIGVFSQIGLNGVMVGIFGVTMWAFIGIGMAARKYYWHQNNVNVR